MSDEPELARAEVIAGQPRQQQQSLQHAAAAVAAAAVAAAAVAAHAFPPSRARPPRDAGWPPQPPPGCMRSAPGPEATEPQAAGLSRHDMVAPCATLSVQILECLISLICTISSSRAGCVVGACGVREP